MPTEPGTEFYNGGGLDNSTTVDTSTVRTRASIVTDEIAEPAKKKRKSAASVTQTRNEIDNSGKFDNQEKDDNNTVDEEHGEWVAERSNASVRRAPMCGKCRLINA